jgi:NAD(P)-dependent dehydrogenase (short-subunit alcohol dehydrogenase family)
VSNPHWTADDIPDQTGRTVIVTGANSGLGLAATGDLARRGAQVILGVRNEARGRAAVAQILAAQPGAALQVRVVDLTDLDSVRTFAAGLHADGVVVDILINNAGVMMPPRSLSAQGNETQFAGNHLGHFALTGLILDLIGGTDPRVVTVSSTLHRRGSIHFDDLTGAQSYSPAAFYSQSKFANVLFGLELDRRLRAAGSPIRSLLAHPGYSATNLQTTGPTGLMKFAGRIGNLVMAQNVAMGALPELYAATAPDVAGGQFYGPDGRGETRGYPTIVQPTPAATDVATARRLWDVSEELTGVSFDLPVPSA